MVTLCLPSVGVVPKRVDYPFYLMEMPFRKTQSLSLWISKVLFKQGSLEELYEELDSDKEYRYDKVVLKRLIRERLPLA